MHGGTEPGANDPYTERPMSITGHSLYHALVTTTSYEPVWGVVS
jgi:hypothetical protein